MIERVGKAAAASQGIGMLRPKHLILEVDHLLVFSGGLCVLTLPVKGESNIVTCLQSIGMLGTEDLFPSGQDAPMLRFGFGRLACIIERNGETVSDQQG